MTSDMTVALRQLLKQECGYIPSETTLDLFLEHTEELVLDAGVTIINPGDVDNDMYIVAKGIIRFADMDGKRNVHSLLPHPERFS